MGGNLILWRALGLQVLRKRPLECMSWACLQI
jgi:hypothetical protein